MVLQLFQVILLIVQGIILLPVGYLVLLTVLALTSRRTSSQQQDGKLTRFAILIPAHNEEVLLPALLKSLQELDYPKPSYQVHVIADNCVDATAEIATSFGAQAHVRFNDTLIGKGYALNWGLSEIRKAGRQYEAYIIIDADSTVSANFLHVMHSQYAAGAKVAQAYYAVKDPELSWAVSLRYAALAVLHYLRPLGRMAWGGSAGLKGNGMLFAQELLDRYPWPASVTEDIEYHMQLLLAGYTVAFAPEATVWGEMPQKFDQSQSQLDRWEHGRIEMARKYVPLLFKAAVQSIRSRDFRQTYRFLDAIAEHLIPPFSVLFGATILLWFVAAVLFAGTNIFHWLGQPNGLSGVILLIGSLTVLAQIVYLLAGLKLVHAPKLIYKRLLYSPLFIVNKVEQYTKVLFGNKPDHWVKTTRNQV